MIRRDIFAVKEWDTAIGAWCYILMTKAFYQAQNVAKFVKATGGRAKLVHPSQKIVDHFLAYGNIIHQ